MWNHNLTITMPHLLDPITFKSITLRNRIGVAPMCQYSATDGLMNDWHAVHLGSFAVGGAGLIIAEATAVSAEGRITPGCAGLWSDKHIEPLIPITRFLKSQGAVPGIQLAHAGRKGSAAIPQNGGAHLESNAGGWQTLAPSALAFGGDLNKLPVELTHHEIIRIQSDFVAAAKRALNSGFSYIELHAAHGYLAHQFLSPLSNKRTDQYGGTFENRIRFLLETVKNVRQVWPDNLPFTVRLSCTDWTEGGWSLDESVALAVHLKAEGVDLIDASTGGNIPHAKIPVAPGFQVPCAERIKKESGIATAAVGLITDPSQAEEIIANSRADLVLLAREMLRNPRWPHYAARVLGRSKDLPPPIQYARAF
jgi:2,4-dienoyl-CoA reductase-like NADH-dependent reductase (Old Yellow Enzyme family)